MIDHQAANNMIGQLHRDLARAAEFTPADWAQAVIIRNAVHDYEAHGGRLSLGHRLALALSDAVFMDYATLAWASFAHAFPEFADMDRCWWDRLRNHSLLIRDPLPMGEGGDSSFALPGEAPSAVASSLSSPGGAC